MGTSIDLDQEAKKFQFHNDFGLKPGSTRSGARWVRKAEIESMVPAFGMGVPGKLFL